MIQLKSIRNPFEEKWILMTPEIAEYFLSNNIGNRTVNERNVSKMVADLKNETWENGPISNTIQVNENDVLCDGQHRLLAIKQSGISIPMRISKINKENAYETFVDRQDKRSLAYIAGIGTNAAAFYNALLDNFYFYENGSKDSRVYSDKERIDFMHDMITKFPESVKLSNLQSKNKIKISTPERVGFFLAYLDGCKEALDTAMEFSHAEINTALALKVYKHLNEPQRECWLDINGNQMVSTGKSRYRILEIYMVCMGYNVRDYKDYQKRLNLKIYLRDLFRKSFDNR